MKVKKQTGQRVFDYFIMGIVIIISLFPFLWVLLSSFKTNSQILSSSFSLPTSFYTDGYRIALEKVDIISRFFTSLFVAGISTVLAVVLYSMAGYVLARTDFKGKKIIFMLLISSMLIPSNAMVQPVYFVINKLGLYDTKAGLILIYTGFGMALSLFLMKNFFMSVPKELEEAATIDGATLMQIYGHIYLPLSKPIISTVIIMTAYYAWNEFVFATIFVDSSKLRTIPVGLMVFRDGLMTEWGVVLAGMVISCLPIIVLFLLMQKSFVRGMTAGAVKG